MHRVLFPGAALVGVLATAVFAAESHAGCRCRGEIGQTLFLSNAECATHCGGSANVDLWPDPTNAMGAAIGAVGSGTPPVPGAATPCPPQPVVRQTFRIGGVPFTVTGRRDRIDELRAFLERMRSDCLGSTIWTALRARFRGAGYDDGMKVFLDDGSEHVGCQSDEHDRSNFSGGAAGLYDGYARMYDGATGTCEYTASALWVRTRADTRFDSPDLLETLSHELTHAAYDQGDPLNGLAEGEYCAHLAGWMIGARLAPSPRGAMSMERHVFPALVEPGTCGYVDRGWAARLREIASVEGTSGRLAAYLRSCAGYPEETLFPSTSESRVCGAGNSSCCPYEPQGAACRQSWVDRVVSRPPAAGGP